MSKLSKNITINITEIQWNTLEKLRARKIKIGQFVRDAIAEKINRVASELTIKPKQICHF